MFVIDNVTGWINTTSELDRESKDSYILIIRASDGKGNSILNLQENSLDLIELSNVNEDSLGFLWL